MARPNICLSLNCKDYDEVKKELDTYLEYADMVELCSDKLDRIKDMSKEEYVNLLNSVKSDINGRTLIVDYKGELEIQHKIIKWSIGISNIVDVDLDDPKRDEIIALAHESNTKVVLSHHEFSRPLSSKEVYDTFLLMEKTNADILKIACISNNENDKFDILNGAREYSSRENSKDIVAISMGLLGRESRVIMGDYGSKISYSCGLKETAPGQYNAKELYDLFIKHYGNN